MSDRSDDLEGHGRLARGLNGIGQLLLFVGGGIILAGLGISAPGALLIGAATGVGGMLMRAAGFAIAAREIEARGVVVSERRPTREAHEATPGINVVELAPTREVAPSSGFVAMIEDQRQSARGFKIRETPPL